jgi:hypothetical protein
MVKRPNRDASRPIGKMKLLGHQSGEIARFAPARVKSHEVYRVRVKSHDGYVECNSSIAADLSDLVLTNDRIASILQIQNLTDQKLRWKRRRLAQVYGIEPGPDSLPTGSES